MRARRMRPRRASDLVEWWKPRMMASRRCKSAGSSLTLTVDVGTATAMPGSLNRSYGIARNMRGSVSPHSLSGLMLPTSDPPTRASFSTGNQGVRDA